MSVRVGRACKKLRAVVRREGEGEGGRKRWSQHGDISILQGRREKPHNHQDLAFANQLYFQKLRLGGKCGVEGHRIQGELLDDAHQGASRAIGKPSLRDDTHVRPGKHSCADLMPAGPVSASRHRSGKQPLPPGLGNAAIVSRARTDGMHVGSNGWNA